MNTSISAVLQSIFADDEPLTPACAACHADLAAYVEADLGGEDAAADFPDVHRHLRQCQDCGQAAAELRTLYALEQGAELEQPPVPGQFDFSYLPPAPAPETEPDPNFWRLDELGRLIIEFSETLLRGLQPPLQPGYLKSAPADAPAHFVLSLGDDLDDLAVSIETVQTDAELAALTVAVDIPSRGGWPHLAGIEVTVGKAADVIATEVTDAFGHALFPGIPLADLPRLRLVINARRSK